MLRHRARLALPALLLALALLAAACGQKAAPTPAPAAPAPAPAAPAPAPAAPAQPAPAPATPVTLTWTAGSLGGGWYSMAGILSELVREKYGHLNIKVVPGGGVQNVAAVQGGQTEIAWGLTPFTVAGLAGIDPYKEKTPDVQLVLGNMFPSYWHAMVAADSPIQSLDQIFRDKMKIHIAVTQVGSSDEWVMRKVFEHYGVTYDQFKAWGGKISFIGYADQANQFKDRNADLVFNVLGIPGASIQEASLGRKARLLAFSPELLKFLNQFGLEGAPIPKGTYPNIVNNDKDIMTAIQANIVIAHKKVPEDVVYAFTKAIAGNPDRVKAANPALADWDPKQAVSAGTIPLHPGAAKALKELGLLK